MSKQKSLKGKLAKIFSKKDSSSAGSFNKQSPSASSPRRSLHEVETVSLFGDNEFSSVDPVLFHENAELSNVETRSLGFESGTTTSGRIRRNKSWSFRHPFTPFRTLLPNSSSLSLEFSSSLESGGDGAEEEQGVSLKDKKHDKPGQWAVLSRKKNKREVRQDTAEADGAGTCPDRRGVAPNTSVAKRIRNLLDRGGINRRSQSDRSGNQQSQSDGGDNQQSQSDRGGNQRPQSDRGGNQRPQSDRGGNQRPQSDRGGNQLSQSDRGGNQRPQSDRGGNQRPQSDRGGDQRSQSDSMNPNESASKSFSCDEASSELDDHSIRAGRSLDSAEGLGVSQSCPVGDTLKGNSGDQVLEQDGVSANPLTESDHDVFCDCDESTDSVSYKPLDTLVKPSSQSTVKAAHVDRGPEHSGQWSRCEADTRRLQSDGGNAGGRIKRNFSNYRSERKSKKHSDDETSKSDTFPRERRRNQDKAPKMSVSELIKSFEQASRKMSTENFTGKEFASQGGSRREAAPHLSRNKNVSRSFKSKAEVQGVDDTFVLKEQVEVREEDGGLTGVGVDASSQEKTAPAPPANDATRGSVRHLKQEEEEEEETAHRGAFPSIDQGNSTPTHTHAGVKQHQEIELPGSHGDHLDFKSTIMTPSECDCTDGLNVSDRSTQLTPKDGTTRGVRQEDRIDGQRIDIHKASDASPIGESVDWADSSSPSPKKVKVLAESNDEMHNLECSSTLITQKFNQDTKTNGNVPENHFSRESEAEQGEALPVSRKRREGTASHSKSYSGLEVPARTARPDGQTKNDTAPSIGVIPNEPARENEHEEISTSLETSGGAPAHRAESSSNTEDGMKVTSIVQPKISRSQEKEKECNLPVSTSAGSSTMEFPKTEDLQTNVDKMMTEPNNADDEVSPSAVSRFGRKVKESESEMVPDNPGEMAKLLDVLNNMDDTENPIPYRKGAKVGPRRNPAWPKDQFLYPIREDSFLETLLEKNAKAGLQPKLNVTPKNEHGSQTLSTQCDKSESYSRARPSITSTRTKLAKRPPREFKYGLVGPQSSPSKNMGLLKEHDDGESQAFNDHPEEGYLQEYREMDQGTCEDHPMEGHLQEYREMDQGTCEVNVPSQLCKCTRHEDSYSLVGPRPGKIVLFEGPGRDGCRFEAWGDEPDCSQWKIRGDACLQVLRGCWIIYEKPDFQGQMAALEEGIAELAQLWGSGMPDATVGSLSLTVRNHSLPAILLFPEEHSRGRFTRYEQEEPMLRISTYSPGPASITVYSGTWLLYPRPHFEGCPLVLEPGFYPTRNSWGADHCSVASLRPMVMGGLKVEHPNDFKIVVYDNVEFSGANIEVFSERSHLNGMSMLSARVYGGVWVGYEEEGFEGRQFLLEEGMFSCYQCWGGRAIGLRSLRPLQYDFSSSFALLSEPETFSESKLLECDGDVISVQEHDIIPHSVNIVAGIWVVYEMEGFCGRQYVLEKGLYHQLSDLGSELRSIGSLRPIRKVHTGSAECSFKVEIFGESDQPGSRLKLHDDCPQIPSQEGGGYLRVHAGRWVAYSAEKFTGSMAVLEPGDAASLDMLIPGSYVHSLRVLPYEFSEPELMLYDRSGLCGRQMSISEDTRSLSAIGYNQPQSILVTGGIWVACEHLNFQGRQLLLEEGDVLNLSQLCGWTGLGSLYHLKQPMVLFCLRSIGVEGVLTVMGTATEATAAQVQVQPYDGSDDQNWVYDQGYLRSQVGDLCLEVMGSRWQPGASVGAWFPQQQLQQKWRIMRDGLIVSLLGSNLVLSVKDGGGYDSNHVALAERQENEPWQRWKVEMV